MPIPVRYYTDPACVWSWGSEPKLRRLAWEFAGELELQPVMGGLARSYGPSYRDDEGRIGAGADCFADLMAHWLEVADVSGMPVDPRLWTEAKLSSTYPACMAVIAAREQGSDAALAYLRRTREALFTERKKLDFSDALIAEAGPAGIDVDRFRIDVGSNAILEAFAADLEETREIPREARDLGKLGRTEGRERISFPSLVFAGSGADRRGVWGWQSYDAYREAALGAGARLVRKARPTAAEAIEHFGRLATREIEELTGIARPVLEAELWSLAREWRLKPTRVLTGTLWELA